MTEANYIERDGAVTSIVLNRPEQLDALAMPNAAPSPRDADA